MKSGIIYADLINTVSEKYSLEIQTPELRKVWMGSFVRDLRRRTVLSMGSTITADLKLIKDL